MRDIHCPKDLGFENTFSGEDCLKEQHYNNCYHCWSTTLAKLTRRVLDKIRAEIMSKDGLEEALEIIDKYRAESEE